MSPGSEFELLARVVSGDHDAFESVMRSHEDRVFSVCLRILGNRELALDATQDTFLTVFRKAGQFQGNSAVGTWIYRIAVNTCYDQMRRAKRRPSESLPEHVDPRDPSAEEALESAALRPEIATALAGLPALSIPAGFTGGGLPVGVQLMARASREDLLYRLAAAVEHQLTEPAERRWPTKPS